MNWFQKALAAILPFKTITPPVQIGTMPVYPKAELMTYINLFGTNASLYTIVSMVARKFGSIPRYVYEVSDPTAETQYKRLIRQKEFKYKQALDLQKKAYEETIVEDNPLSEIMMEPNEWQNQDSYYELGATYYLLCGEAFEYLNRGLDPDLEYTDDEIEQMPILERWWLPPQYVGLTVQRDDNSVLGGQVVGYFIMNNGKPIPLRIPEVLHWKKPNPNFNWFTLDHFRGLSPLQPGLKILTQDDAATDASVAMYQNGGARGALVNKGMNNLDDKQLSSIDRAIDSKVNYRGNKGSIARIPGDWDYLSFGQTSVEMELVDASDKIFVKICNLYGVNPNVFMTGSTFNNVQQARADLITNLVLPMCCSLRDEENEDFLTAFGMNNENVKPGQKTYTTDCDVSMLMELQDDITKVTQSLQGAWWLTVNEKRCMMEQEELDDPNCDIILVPNNLVPLDDAAMPMETPMNTPYGQGTNMPNGQMPMGGMDSGTGVPNSNGTNGRQEQVLPNQNNQSANGTGKTHQRVR